jgi:metal-responsive CopG/Arc/MetJ family transcriptional regulator
MSAKNSKFTRITVTLTPEQLDLLTRVSTENGYESISATLRVLVTKYGKKELQSSN